MSDQKGGLGKRFHHLIFEDTPQNSSAKSGSQPSTPDVPVFTTSITKDSSRPRTSFVASASNDSVDPSMLAEVEKALAERSAPAYKQFTQLLSNLATKLPDESTRYAAALAVAPSMQLELPAIRSAFDGRLGILDDLQKHFEDQSQQELDKRVKGTQAEVDSIDEEMDATSKSIAKLNSHLEELKQSKEEKSASIAHDSDNIATVRKQMLIAFEAIRAKATTERDTVSRHTSGS
jgi:chromosome segregation ATPase